MCFSLMPKKVKTFLSGQKTDVNNVLVIAKTVRNTPHIHYNSSKIDSLIGKSISLRIN